MSPRTLRTRKENLMIPAFFITTNSLETHPLVIKIISALLILIAGFILGKIIGLILKRVLQQINIDKHLATTLGHRLALEKRVSGVISTIIYIVAIFIALQTLTILKYTLLIIGGGFALVLFISLLLILKDTIPNFLVGISKTYRQKMIVGKTLRIRQIQGKIIKKTLFTTIVQEQEDKIHIPNRIFKKETYTVKKK